MQGPGTPQPPGEAGQVRRRRLFQSPASAPTPGPVPPPADAATAAGPIVAFYHQAISQQLEQGLAAIRETATALMYEVAEEVWRSAGGDADSAQSKILSALSRDEAIRGLIAHSDERFQTVAMRVSQLEDTLQNMADSTEAVKEAVLRGAAVLQETVGSPELRDAEEARVRLVELEHHLTGAFQQLEERDSQLMETLRSHLDEERTRALEETGRIAVEAIEGPIQGGVEMIDRLTKRVEEQSSSTAEQADELMGRMTQSVEQQIRLMNERLWDTLTSLGEHSGQLQEVVVRSAAMLRDASGAPPQELVDRLGEMETALAASIQRLTDRDADLVRSISGRLAESLRSSLESNMQPPQALIDEANRLGQVVQTQLQTGVSAMQQLVERAEEREAALSETVSDRMQEHGKVVSRETSRIVEALEGYLHSGVETMGRLAQQVENHAKAADDRAEQIGMKVTEAMELQGTHIDELSEKVRIDVQELRGDARASAEEAMKALDKRLFGLAQLVRSDSEALRRELHATVETGEGSIASVLDERLARVSEFVGATTRWAVDEATTRAAEAGEAAGAGRSASVSDRLEALTGEIRRMEAGIATVETGLRDVMETTVATTVESRLGALAKMIRSDNRILAEKLQTAIDQDASKRSLRAMKEMQARMPTEISEAVNQRFERLSDQLHREAQSMAESMAKTTDVLGARVDRAAAAMNDRMESDLRGINERLGETMEVLKAIRSASSDRIELE
ncbi:MAG: hypothetical protein M3O84_07740 [Actinomycetota bacterium]|nr:hypothetical protein [Actinomycetota bacterium]